MVAEPVAVSTAILVMAGLERVASHRGRLRLLQILCKSFALMFTPRASRFEQCTGYLTVALCNEAYSTLSFYSGVIRILQAVNIFVLVKLSGLCHMLCRSQRLSKVFSHVFAMHYKQPTNFLLVPGKALRDQGITLE